MMPTDDTEGRSDALKPNPTARRSPRSADDVARLAHELSNLLDGSIRWLALADRNLAKGQTDPVEQARRQLDTVRISLVRMADLVNAALKSRHLGLGSPMLGRALGTSLQDAVLHATQVLRPRAEELGIQFQIELTPQVAAVPCGSLYSVILNGLSNAVDSIEQAQSIATGGLIRVTGRLGQSTTTGRTQIEIDIIDDGAGLADDAPLHRVFEPGFSTRTGPRGIGLAVCHNIIAELGGTIALMHHPARIGNPRPGAVLRFFCPEPNDGSQTIGGGQ